MNYFLKNICIFSKVHGYGIKSFSKVLKYRAVGVFSCHPRNGSKNIINSLLNTKGKVKREGKKPFQNPSVAEPGCFCPRSRIPDPIFSVPDPGLTRSRIQIRTKEFKYFSKKKWYTKFSQIRSRMNIPDLDIFPSWIPDPDAGSRGQKSTGSRM
jgi:hypothetical protein